MLIYIAPAVAVQAYIDCVYTVDAPNGKVQSEAPETPSSTHKRRGRTADKAGSRARAFSPDE